MSAALALPVPPPPSLAGVATAFELDPIEVQMLWRAAAYPLNRLGSSGQIVAATIRLTRLGLLECSDTGHMRLAPDVRRALQGHAPCLPRILRSVSHIAPWGEAWTPPTQTRLVRALQALQSGAARWVAIPSAPGDGVLDAIAAERPALEVRTDDLPPNDLDRALDAAVRHARLRRFWPVLIARRQSWPWVRRWAETASGPFVVACARGPQTLSACQVVPAESLSVSARHAIWAAEVDPVTAGWLARRHAVGRAGIIRAVDAVRLRGAPLCVESLTHELDALR